MPRTPLPDEFAAAPFLFADAVAAGVQPSRLRALDLAAPFNAVRVARGRDRSMVDRHRLLLPRLATAQYFSHATAAAIWGLPLPRHIDDEVVHVGSIHPAREPRTRGVVGHRLTLDFDHLTLVDGMPVPVLPEVIAQLGGLLALDELIAVIDHVRTRFGTPPAEIDAAIRRVRRAGAETLRCALTESRAGSESPRESATRLILVRAGLPEPELNIEIRDARDALVARLDMAYRRWKVAVEYDGRQHAEDLWQFRRDADRWAAIEAEGWLLIRVLDHHLRRPDAMVVDRVRRALLSRGWTPPASRT